MKYFLESLRERNEHLFFFGLSCLAFAIICFLMAKTSAVEVNGARAWYKPFKFASSIFIYSWSMAWYCYYLPSAFNSKLYTNVVIIALAFDILYIAMQAARGQTSHYNLSTPFYSIMLLLMTLAATIVTLWTGYVGLLFFTEEFPGLPDYYIWGIRIGIFLFVIFSLEGFVMGGNRAHTVGAEDGTVGVPILNWSMTNGDLRIAHFIGMHALQIIPLMSFYFLRSNKLTIILGALYLALASIIFLQATSGRPFIKVN